MAFSLTSARLARTLGLASNPSPKYNRAISDSIPIFNQVPSHTHQASFGVFCSGERGTKRLGQYKLRLSYQIQPNEHMIYGQNDSWGECCGHEEEIQILQEKLMEVHNKLIDQLDICKEQELKIIELSKKNSSQHQSSSNNFDTFNYQSFGHASPPLQENQAPNYFNSIGNDSSQSHHMKTELLQADLEAMRNKVLAQITEKNKLKEQLKEIKSREKKNAQLERRRFEGLEEVHRKLAEEHQHILSKYDKLKRSYRSESQVDKLSLMLAEIEGKYAYEKESNRRLQSRCRELEQILEQCPSERVSSCGSRGSRQSIDPSTVKHQQKQIDYLKNQIQRINSQVGSGRESRPRKRGFQQTKDLIKKLEETQSIMRRNRRPIS